MEPAVEIIEIGAETSSAEETSSADKKDNEAPHLDLNGNPFTLPTFTMKEIHDAIPAHCFKPSTLRSMAYVVRDFAYLGTLIYLATTYIPLLPSASLRFLAWVAYTTVQGFVFTGIWILAHECGHGAFSKSKKLNWTMGLIMHSFLLVPFHSWRLSHSQHHKATGNMDKDTAFVPHTRTSWLKRNTGGKFEAGMEGLVEFAELAEDSPIASLWNCIVHQLFGWPGYLLFNLTGQEYGGAKGMKISHFYFGKDSVFYKKSELGLILLSDVGVAVMIAALVVAGQVFGSWNVIVLWGVPWLWVNNWIGKLISPFSLESLLFLFTVLRSLPYFSPANTHPLHSRNNIPPTHRRLHAPLRQLHLDICPWRNRNNRPRPRLHRHAPLPRHNRHARLPPPRLHNPLLPRGRSLYCDPQSHGPAL
jgi:omega-6 fatty acid desaturase (delta-12 desaturase)